MQTRLLATWRLNQITGVSCLSANTFVVSSRETSSWYHVDGFQLDEVLSLSNDGESGPLYSLRGRIPAVLQIRLGSFDSSLRLVNENGFGGQLIGIPFHGFYQVTCDLTGSFLAGFGPVSTPGRIGYLEPVESCVIDVASGDLQRLPYSALAIKGNDLYFVKDRTVYKTKLAFQRSTSILDNTFSGDPLEQVASDRVLLVVPRDDYVWLATERGLFAANSMDVVLVHKWDSVGRVNVCGDVFFATGIGPEIQIYDTRHGLASCVVSSSKTQVMGFDTLCLSSGNGSDEGLLMVVSEKGVLDCFSWRSSNGN
jgi:hypothetical protein